jgi:predicted glycosyltransferase involved in capsule biosynthesis
MVTISFAITACNEHEELDRLLNQLHTHINDGDEIIVQLDKTATKKVHDIAKSYETRGTRYEYEVIEYPLNNDFSSFKNNLKNKCYKDWIFFIDADEYLSEGLLDNIHSILNINKGLVDVIAVPRINTVNGLTRDHIDKWKWFVDENGWINYPDYQTRICFNSAEINWTNKVHERLSGWKRIANLPEGYDLIHPKTIERQERQNNFYNTL